MAQKVSYYSKTVYLATTVFSLNDISSHLHICEHSIVTFGIREKKYGSQTLLMLTVYKCLEDQLLIRSKHIYVL